MVNNKVVEKESRQLFNDYGNIGLKFGISQCDHCGAEFIMPESMVLKYDYCPYCGKSLKD